MRHTYPAVLVFAATAMACSHTHAVSKQDDNAAQEQATGHDHADNEKGSERAKRHEPSGVRGESSNESSTKDGSSPPLPASPQGMLREGAAGDLQDKLIERGYLDKSLRSGSLDGDTVKALRAFQRDNGMPATGVPDDLTVTKLGLSPKDLFRASPAPRQ